MDIAGLRFSSSVYVVSVNGLPLPLLENNEINNPRTNVLGAVMAEYQMPGTSQEVSLTMLTSKTTDSNAP